MTVPISWTPPRAAPGDWVIYTRTNGCTVEGTVLDVTTTYPAGRASHTYRVQPFAGHYCHHVPESALQWRGQPDTYGAIRYRPTRTHSDARTDAAA